MSKHLPRATVSQVWLLTDGCCHQLSTQRATEEAGLPTPADSWGNLHTLSFETKAKQASQKPHQTFEKIQQLEKEGPQRTKETQEEEKRRRGQEKGLFF